MLESAAYRYINGELQKAYIESDIELSELLAVSDNVELADKNIASFVMSVDSYKEGMYKFSKSFWSKTTAALYLSISLLLLFGGLILMFLDSIINLINNGKETSIL